jgi:hypothetical protein
MLHLIKQMVKLLVLWVMRKTLSNYSLKASAKTVLTNQLDSCNDCAGSSLRGRG